MMRTVVRALLATIVFAVLTGLLYPLAMTTFAQVTFKDAANGSLVEVNGQPVGSSLIGQQWNEPTWFYGRPSAVEDDASTSSGSNLGPRSKDLADDIAKRAAAVIKVESPYHPGLQVADIPVDLLTSSGSGLDPDISVEAARFQAPRIAAERNLALEQVLALIDGHTQTKSLGFLGEPRVNVLELNIALQGVAPSA
jgi:potassium-transporting ATPase KdpC subunit